MVGLISILAKPKYLPLRGALEKRASALLAQLSNRGMTKSWARYLNAWLQ